MISLMTDQNSGSAARGRSTRAAIGASARRRCRSARSALGGGAQGVVAVGDVEAGEAQGGDAGGQRVARAADRDVEDDAQRASREGVAARGGALDQDVEHLLGPGEVAAQVLALGELEVEGVDQVVVRAPVGLAEQAGADAQEPTAAS